MDERGGPHEVAVKGLVPTGNLGAGLGIAYAALCFAFWANSMGFCDSIGFGISIGVVLIGFFFIYLVAGLYFLKQGNTLFGAIFVVFSAVFGLFSGGINLTAAICAQLGVPCDTTIMGISFILAGAYLLFALPAMRSLPVIDICTFLFSGIGVVAYGFATLGIGTELANMVGGWTILVGGAASYYSAVAGTLASAGIAIPTGAHTS